VNIPRVHSGITFFYYSDLSEAREFYEGVLGLEVVDDQGWAVIYKVNGSCFFGLVDEENGFCKAQESNAVLFTLVVENVEEWYGYLKEKDVRILSEPETKEDIGVKCFFLKDPAGYALEIQEFTKPEKANLFAFPKE